VIRTFRVESREARKRWVIIVRLMQAKKL